MTTWFQALSIRKNFFLYTYLVRKVGAFWRGKRKLPYCCYLVLLYGVLLRVGSIKSVGQSVG